MSIEIEWRAEFTSAEASTLHAGAFSTPPSDDPPQDWNVQVQTHSLGWATARRDEVLVGFCNVIWDGAGHAWLQDVMVATNTRHRGVGTALVATARREAARAGCQWLHVDFAPDLRAFYLNACSFQTTEAGLLRLDPGGDQSSTATPPIRG